MKRKVKAPLLSEKKEQRDANGSLILLLHAHLPYVCHPEHEYSLEENWLFEALAETYLPLLDVLETLVRDGISPNITISFSPTLTEMLNDPMLRQRFVRYLDNLLRLCESERGRLSGSPFSPAVEFYLERLHRVRSLYLEQCGQDVVAAFSRLQDDGHIELITTAATHAFLPAFQDHPWAVRKQIEIGVKSYERNFGRKPAGFWLPECAYFKGLDSMLSDYGIKYTFLESHGLVNARPRPRCSVYQPVETASGLRVFGRDQRASRQVWCADSGYPGDPWYRDFYRDIGFELPVPYVKKYTGLGFKTFTGLKYHRITAKCEKTEKLAYERDKALGRAAEHARHFLMETGEDLGRLLSYCSKPVVVAAFDAELFGHWWFEGIDWLSEVLKMSAHPGRLSITTPSSYLSGCEVASIDQVEPSPSTWGDGGYSAFWIGQHNNGLYRHLHSMAERMESISRNLSSGSPANSCKAAVLALRELLLAQASDWAFLMEKDRNTGYATERVSSHIRRFNALYEHIKDGRKNFLLEEPGCAIFPWLEEDD